MQGVVWMYNVLSGKEQKQFNILVLAWTNGSITVPIDFLFWYPKHSCDQYKTKSELTIELLHLMRDYIFQCLVAQIKEQCRYFIPYPFVLSE